MRGRIGMRRMSVVGAALLGVGLLGAPPAQAQFVYPYGYYGYRPYYVPFYQPRALFVPPPVVAVPRPVVPVFVPRAAPRRRIMRAKLGAKMRVPTAARPAPPPAPPQDSPFSGPGMEGVVPASGGVAPFVAPIPGLRPRPGAGDLPRELPPAPVAPPPAAVAPAPQPPSPPADEGNFRGD